MSKEVSSDYQVTRVSLYSQCQVSCIQAVEVEVKTKVSFCTLLDKLKVHYMMNNKLHTSHNLVMYVS